MKAKEVLQLIEKKSRCFSHIDINRNLHFCNGKEIANMLMTTIYNAVEENAVNLRSKTYFRHTFTESFSRKRATTVLKNILQTLKADGYTALPSLFFDEEFFEFVGSKIYVIDIDIEANPNAVKSKRSVKRSVKSKRAIK